MLTPGLIKIPRNGRKLHERLNSNLCYHIVNAISLPYFTTFLLSFPRFFVSYLLDSMNPFSVSISCLSVICFLRYLYRNHSQVMEVMEKCVK
jgi:hypothetical protein